MQRKKLLTLPREIPENIPQAQHIIELKDWPHHIYHYYYSAFCDSSTGEEVLIIDVYKPAPEAELNFRLFQTAEKWFLVESDGKTSERSLNCYEFQCRQKFHAISGETVKVINDYVSKRAFVKGDGIIKVANWQDQIRRDRLNKKYNRIKESISKEMLEIRPLPKTVDEWITDHVMQDQRFMFYEYASRKRVTAHCSHCGETVEINRPKRDEQVRCPNCHSTCTARPYDAYMRTYGFGERRIISYIQQLRDGRICERQFEVTWQFYGCARASIAPTRPHKSVYEVYRRFIRLTNSNSVPESLYTKDNNYKGGEWRHSDGDYCYSNTYIYSENLNKIFKRREGFNKYHIDFNKIALLCNPLSIKKFIIATNEYEFLMNLVNNNLTNLAHDVICYGVDNFDKTKGSLRKSCGITKDELPLLQAVNPDLSDFYLYRDYQKSGRKITYWEFKKLVEINGKCSLSTRLVEKISKYSSFAKFAKWFDYLETHYFRGRADDNRYYGRYSNFLRDYRDYLDCATLLHYDLKNPNILFPQNFKSAHDEAYKIVNDQSFRDGELPQIKEQYAEYSSKFCFEDKDFLIRPPHRHNELKEEGKKLHHCVATYAKRVALGQTIILFIRKKSEPNKPYFTLNLDPEDLHIIQNRGCNNCSYPKEVEKFMNKWYAVKVEPLKKGEFICQKTA